MRIACIIFLFPIVGCNSMSQKTKIDSKAIPLISSFFNEVDDGNDTTALKNLLLTNPYMNVEDSSSLTLFNNFRIINKTSGQLRSFKILKKKCVNNNICLYSYLVNFEKKFYRFIFTFYDNGTTVRLYKFQFDDNIDTELEETLKYYLH